MWPQSKALKMYVLYLTCIYFQITTDDLHLINCKLRRIHLVLNILDVVNCLQQSRLKNRKVSPTFARINVPNFHSSNFNPVLQSCLGSFFFAINTVKFSLDWFEETWNLCWFYTQYVKIHCCVFFKYALCISFFFFFFEIAGSLIWWSWLFICYLHSPCLLQLYKCRRCSGIWITAQQFAHFRVQFEFRCVTNDFKHVLKSSWKSVLQVLFYKAGFTNNECKLK